MRATLLLCLGASLAGAQERGPITIVAPAAPGGGWDQLARTMQRVLESERLAVRVQVENIPGAAGTVGLARFISGRRGDGAALLVTGLVMVGGVVQNASPVSLRHATPMARLVGEYEAIAVPASSPWRTLGDLLAALKSNPGAVSFGGGSAGGTDQMLVDLIAGAIGVDPRRLNYVAFSGGGEARTALLGAQVSAGVSGIGEFAELARAGQVRLLAVSSEMRIAGWDVPTLREAGVDVALSNWRGVLAPPGLAPAERAHLEATLESMARSVAWRDELRTRGWEDAWLGSASFARFVDAESRRVEGIAAARRGTVAAGGGIGTSLPLVLIAGLMVTLGLVLRSRRREAAADPPSCGGVGLAIGGLAANAVLIDLVGFVLASALLFASTALAFRERQVRRVALVAAGFSLVVFALFRYALDVPLPVGSLWGMVR